MTVAENLKAIRKKRRLSQEQLEIRSGVSQSGISAIERGERVPTIDTLKLLAQGLRVPLDELLTEEMKEKPANDVSGLDEQLIEMLVNLPDSDVQRVKDFVAGLKASRKA